MKNPYCRAEIEAAAVQSMFKTARRGGVVKPKLPGLVAERGAKDARILDYGAGKMVGTDFLRGLGHDVVPYDLALPETYDALNGRYNVIMASCVLNVQPSPELVEHVLAEVWDLLNDGGWFFCNFPQDPRKNILTGTDVMAMLERGFVVELIDGSLKVPFFGCTKL